MQIISRSPIVLMYLLHYFNVHINNKQERGVTYDVQQPFTDNFNLRNKTKTTTINHAYPLSVCFLPHKFPEDTSLKYKLYKRQMQVHRRQMQLYRGQINAMQKLEIVGEAGGPKLEIGRFRSSCSENVYDHNKL